MTAEDSTRAVVDRHVAAVRDGDPAAMAADYASDAVLVRGAAVHRGRDAIAAYFATVPHRLGGGTVSFSQIEVTGEQAVLHWRIDGGSADGTRGTDTCTVRGGEITEQVVRLAGPDF